MKLKRLTALLLAGALSVAAAGAPVQAGWFGSFLKGLGQAMLSGDSGSSSGTTTATQAGTATKHARSGNMWVDERADIQAKQFKKVVLFPISYLNEGTAAPSYLSSFNNHLHKEANKRIKKVNFLGFGEQLEEKKYILRDNPQFQSLLQPFANEEARAKAVYDITAADGYLIPHISRDTYRVDVSPEKTVTVTMESYYDIVDGPKGTKRKLDYRSWEQTHTVPRMEQKLEILDMDFVLYDAYTGRKAMTYQDFAKNYSDDQEKNFNEITRNLTKAWSRLKKDKDQKVKEGAPTLGFRPFEVPEAVKQNEFAMRNIQYAVEDEAGDTLKKVKVDYNEGGGQYYVTGRITKYEEGEVWHEPGASASPSCVNVQYFEWYDKDNKKHKGHYDYYRTTEADIKDYYGHYSFDYTVGISLQLVDARTGTVLYSTFGEETDDCYNDALRHVLHKFYKHAEDVITGD